MQGTRPSIAGIGEVYNIAGMNLEENLTLAGRVLRIIRQSETLISFVRDRPGHDTRYALDCRKIERELGWKPQITLESGLQQTIAWYKTNHKWLAGVRDGSYRSYYAKYYENRDSSLDAITPSITRLPSLQRLVLSIPRQIRAV